jgi:hypothetical protein
LLKSCLTDGADELRSLGEAASPGPTHHVLDWFHLALRIQHAAQASKSWPDRTEGDQLAGKRLADTIERIRWRLWHGKNLRALDLIEETAANLEAMTDNTVAQKVARLLRERETYVSGLSAIIVNYAKARGCDQPISTAITERTVLGPPTVSGSGMSTPRFRTVSPRIGPENKSQKIRESRGKVASRTRFELVLPP